MLRRQSSLNGLFGTLRLALHDQQLNSVLLHDWQRQDLHSLAKSALQAAANFAHLHQHTGNEDEGGNKRRTNPEAVTINPATVEFVASREQFNTLESFK